MSVEIASLETLKSDLQAHGQSHVLGFWDDLSEAERAGLVGQLAQVDLDELARLIADEDEKPDFAAMAERAQPPQAVGIDGAGVDWSVADAVVAGEEALRAGKLAAIVVAGGQGTRLGFDLPKGMFPIGPVSGRTLFQMFADRIAALSAKYGVSIPLYVMTSEATDAETRAYFSENDHWGLDENDVRIFKQGTMPAVDAETGKLLLDDKSSLALSPNGHGGTVEALDRSGALAEMRTRGIDHLFYFQVDNPLIQLLDPAFIGHHLLAGSELTSQVVRKRYPTERVGNVVEVDGRLQIIEYSDLPESAAQLTQADGSLKIWAGSIAVHVVCLDFLDRVKDSATALPFHRASKKVPFLGEDGERCEPEQPNAIKFEKFIFDLLPQARNGLVVEVCPAEAFAPVKNAEGAENDTPSLARQAISQLHKRWLRAAGVQVGDDVLVEISPFRAIDETDLSSDDWASQTVSSDRFFD